MRLIPLLLVPLAVLLSVFLLTPQAAPVVYAQPAGWVELVEERTQTGKVFFDPSRPGARLTEVSVAKVHYDGPDWKEIDNTLVPSLANIPTLGLADLEMTKDDYEFYALQTLNTIPLWFYRNKSLPDQYITFNPQALQWTNDLDQIDQVSMPQSVAGVVTENRLHWEDAYGLGRNLSISAQPGRLAKILTLEAMPPAPAQYILDGGNPVLELRFIFATASGPNAPEIWINGVEWDQSARTETVGVVELRFGGETVLVMAEPTAFDSSGLGLANTSFVFTKQGPNLRVGVRVPLSFLETATYPVFIDPTLDAQIAAGADDGWSNEGGAFYPATTQMGPGQYSALIRNAWGRFDGMPGMDSVISANISVVADSSGFDGVNTRSDIFAEDADDPAAPTTEPDHNGRTRTTAFTAWDDVDFVVGVETWSPDITDVIAEILARPGFGAGNAIQILWDDGGSSNGKAYLLRTYENVIADSMQLHIVYVAWANTAPTITNKITTETTTVDEAYARSFTATDPDTNQTLQWELNTTDAPFTLTVWNGGNRTTWVNATPDTVGTYYVNVTVGDDALGPSGNETDYVNYTLTVVAASSAGTLFDTLLPVGFAVAGFFIVVGLLAIGRPGGATMGGLMVFIGGIALILTGFDYQLSIQDGEMALAIIVGGVGIVAFSAISLIPSKRH